MVSSALGTETWIPACAEERHSPWTKGLVRYTPPNTPLGLDQHPRGKAPLRSTPRMGLTYSGAWEESAQGHWTEGLVGENDRIRGFSSQLTPYAVCSEERIVRRRLCSDVPEGSGRSRRFRTGDRLIIRGRAAMIGAQERRGSPRMLSSSASLQPRLLYLGQQTVSFSQICVYGLHQEHCRNLGPNWTMADREGTRVSFFRPAIIAASRNTGQGSLQPGSLLWACSYRILPTPPALFSCSE